MEKCRETALLGWQSSQLWKKSHSGRLDQHRRSLRILQALFLYSLWLFYNSYCGWCLDDFWSRYSEVGINCEKREGNRRIHLKFKCANCALVPSPGGKLMLLARGCLSGTLWGSDDCSSSNKGKIFKLPRRLERGKWKVPIWTVGRILGFLRQRTLISKNSYKVILFRIFCKIRQWQNFNKKILFLANGRALKTSAPNCHKRETPV